MLYYDPILAVETWPYRSPPDVSATEVLGSTRSLFSLDSSAY